MQKSLVALLGRTRMGAYVAGPLGVTLIVAILASGIWTASPPPKVTAQAPAGIACSDGNMLDGDCCSAAGFQEESRFGFVVSGPGDIASRATECAISGTNHCEDGLDNDGDGLADGEDPECASLTELQRQVLVGTDPTARNSIRTGSEYRIVHSTGSGMDVAPSDFVIAGTCAGGLCACPDTLTGYSSTDPRDNDPNTILTRPAC